MPYKSGLEAIQEIKAYVNILNQKAKKKGHNNTLQTEEARVKMPIFCMYSQHQQRGFLKYALSKGVDHVISKPPNQDEILKIVMKALEEKI